MDPKSLRYFMDARGVTREQLADRVGVTPRAVRGWECRERIMGSDVIVRIRDALSLHPPEVSALVAWAGEGIDARQGGARG